MLQETLYEDDVIAVGFVNLCCVPLAKTVGADAIETQIIADCLELFLDSANRERKDEVISADVVSQTIILNILLNYQRDCKGSALAGFLLCEVETVTISISDDIAGGATSQCR